MKFYMLIGILLLSTAKFESKKLQWNKNNDKCKFEEVN